MIRSLVGFVGLAASVMPSFAHGQGLPDPPPPTVISLRPAAAPVPALKLRLLPERRELVAGNAAVFYHRAIEMLLQKRLERQAGVPPSPPASLEQTISQWITGPLREIPREEARKQLQLYGDILHEVELGARREVCDWGFERREEGISLLIPEIQEMRSLGRIVVLRARLAVLEDETDEAIRWLQTGFAMSRHIGQGPFLIQSLVGIATFSQMTRALEDLIQAPGTPSLYWALANLPRPFIDLAPAIEAERYVLERELPLLSQIETVTWSLDQARQFSDDMLRTLSGLTLFSILSPGAEAGVRPPRLRDLAPRLGMVAAVIKVYPEARHALLAEGRPAAQVEEMPAVQVASIYALRDYQRLRDEVFKWSNLPYWQSVGGGDEAMREGAGRENPLLLMFNQLLPAIHAAEWASVRSDRQLNAIECIEAIRLYAAAHGGALPPSLEAITEAPTPLDPATGKPFDYKAGEARATLTAPVPPGAPGHHTSMIRYELKPSR